MYAFVFNAPLKASTFSSLVSICNTTTPVSKFAVKSSPYVAYTVQPIPRSFTKNLPTMMADGKSGFNLPDVGGAISFGTISGFCAGFACKKIGEAAAVAFGVLFIIFQLAAMKGYVTINWDVVERDVMGKMDINNDGKVDAADGKYVITKTVEKLSANMAATGAGFAAGFALGVTKG